MARSATPNQQHVLTVSQLTAQFQGLVEREFPSVWVAGEISNFSRPQSGHCYFTLKDEAAQLRAVMWRSTAARLKFDLQDGLEVICRGRLDVYPPRGSYQLVVEQLQPQGVGALELALRKLREKLSREGLFAAERKRPLPTFPQRVGVVTSPTGAAIRDFLEVLRRRWRGVEVLIFPARVQGDSAAEEVVAGLRQAQLLQPPLDVLVVCRGGGSAEDLWTFNTEQVVRALAASPVPTVSAVGHEIDVTLADLVADQRALTPSEAAELVVPAAEDVRQRLHHCETRLRSALSWRATSLRNRLEGLARRAVFTRPLERVHHLGRRLDEQATYLDQRIKLQLREQHNRLAALGGKLETLSPLGVLQRGYSLTQARQTGRLITQVGRLRPGEQLITRFAQGSAVSTVDSIEPPDPDKPARD